MTSVDWTACKNRKTSGKLLSRWHKRSANYLQTIRKWIIDRTDGWAGLALEQVPHCKTYECVKAMSATICKCVMITCAGHQYSRSYRLLPSTSTSNIHMASLEAVTVKSLNFYPFGILCESVFSFEAYTLSRISRCRCEITSDSCATVQFWWWALQPTLMTSAFLDALLQLLLHWWVILQKTSKLAIVVSFAPHVDDQCIPWCIAALLLLLHQWWVRLQKKFATAVRLEPAVESPRLS